MNPLNRDLFEIAGSTTDQIDVKISHRIIQLFSEGLYSSPNKAVEELVSNSFDAGAQNVHIILSPDLREANATIVVIDDGEGMNNEGLKKHWIIGESTRRRVSSRRKPIGKFGIGKLSTYVLASKLTHISKFGNIYYAATMDYTNLTGSAENASKGVFDEQTIQIPLRILTKQQAQDAVRPWTNGTKEGYKAFRLFGKNAPSSWTVAIMSGLKEMGKKISIGRLNWVLRTAMPQRGDFHLFLDGDPITPPETDEPLAKLVIGKDVIQMPKPCPEGLIAREDTSQSGDSVYRYGVYHDRLLGRITGYIEIFKDEIDAGKPKFEQSHGFFVYVHGRQVNVDDLGFGIERNLLRHGTFSKFRMVVHIDSLDEALRSSRESFQQGDLHQEAQNFLRACFNLARNKLVEYERSQTPAALISARISSAPGSMTRKPLLSLAQMVAEKRATPFYLRFPSGLSATAQTEFLEELKQKAEEADGLLRSTELSVLDSKEGLAILDVQQGKLLINTSHPFVAAFQEFFTDSRRNLPLEMLAMSEILMEAHLYHMGLDESVIRDAIGRRDELLRQFVRSSARRTAGMIALALTDARNDDNKLEEEMRAAFEAMGFANVIRIGGSGKPDGTAEAHLAAAEDGRAQRYKVGLEAKSGQPVSAHRLNVSGIARHMQDYNCNHHLVIGNGFATSTGEDSASVREIKDLMKNSGKTITLMHIDDLARLIRIASAKRVGGLSRLRDLFRRCVTPEESKVWVDNLAAETPANWPYMEILETVWHLAEEQPNEVVEYAAVITELRHRTPPVRMNKPDLIECCKAMQVMARGVVFARENTVEIDRRPDLILEDIRAAVGEYPEEERRTIHI
ncbi:MAG: ATP-binding protein [Deltaproteobacteria bacterium]|nr:ATP-binding protein [Deltaproteobacteria bacterium]